MTEIKKLYSSGKRHVFSDATHYQSDFCPRCGKADGWYVVFAVKYTQFYTAEGDSDGTGDYEQLTGRANGARCRCANCHKQITHLIKPLIDEEEPTQ